MTMAAADEDDWLAALAASRQPAAGGAPSSRSSSSAVTTSRDAHGRLVVTAAVRLSPTGSGTSSPSAVAAETSIAQLLLQAFVDATSPRGVEVTVVDTPPPADANAGDAAGVWRHLCFTAAADAMEVQVEEAAGLFEVHHLHCVCCAAISLLFPIPPAWKPPQHARPTHHTHVHPWACRRTSSST